MSTRGLVWMCVCEEVLIEVVLPRSGPAVNRGDLRRNLPTLRGDGKLEKSGDGCRPETVFPELRGDAGPQEQGTNSRGLRCYHAGKNAGGWLLL